MAAVPVRPDNSILLVAGWVYKFGNSERGGQWVVITDLDRRYVYAGGVENNQADLKIPRWKFDDIVAYTEGAFSPFREMEDGAVRLLEDGSFLQLDNSTYDDLGD